MNDLQIFNSKYLKPFHCVQLEVLESDGNIWNHETMCKQ